MLAFVTSIYNNIKNYLMLALALGGAAFAALFLFERNKAQIDQALLDESKLNEKLASDNNQITQNNEALKTEEQKREEINASMADETTPTNLNDVSKWFNNRK